MGIIESGIKEAFNMYKKDGDLLKLVREIAHVADYSIRCQSHAAIMYEAITDYCPPQLFECLYYDGENGGIYHLLDFDPNGISKKALLEKIKDALKYQLHIELDYIDKALEGVYLLNANTLIKVNQIEDEK